MKAVAMAQNRVVYIKTHDWCIFIMNDLAELEEARKVMMEMYACPFMKLIESLSTIVSSTDSLVLSIRDEECDIPPADRPS